jgi:hypothetical protein
MTDNGLLLFAFCALEEVDELVDACSFSRCLAFAGSLFNYATFGYEKIHPLAYSVQ